ncbi:MAG: flavodoxin [Candidatus Thorarchaeota archaeon]
MKILIAYYSRTGTTKAVAERLAQQLGADLDEIADLQERLGTVNYMRAARAAKGLKTTEIRYEKNPEDYDVIVIGTPIWWNNLPPAPRTYLSSFDLRGKKVAFFITSQSEERENVFSQLRELIVGADVLGTFGVLQKVVKSEDYSEALVTFLETVKVESIALAPIPLIN